MGECRPFAKTWKILPQHSGTVVSTDGSQQKGSWFKARLGPYRVKFVCLSFLCLCGFPPITLSTLHSPDNVRLFVDSKFTMGVNVSADAPLSLSLILWHPFCNLSIYKESRYFVTIFLGYSKLKVSYFQLNYLVVVTQDCWSAGQVSPGIYSLNSNIIDSQEQIWFWLQWSNFSRVDVDYV